MEPHDQVVLHEVHASGGVAYIRHSGSIGFRSVSAADRERESHTQRQRETETETETETEKQREKDNTYIHARSESHKSYDLQNISSQQPSF